MSFGRFSIYSPNWQPRFSSHCSCRSWLRALCIAADPYTPPPVKPRFCLFAASQSVHNASRMSLWYCMARSSHYGWQLQIDHLLRYFERLEYRSLLGEALQSVKMALPMYSPQKSFAKFTGCISVPAYVDRRYPAQPLGSERKEVQGLKQKGKQSSLSSDERALLYTKTRSRNPRKSSLAPQPITQ